MKAFPISLFRLAAMVVLTGSFGHEDVLALPVDLKAQLLESAHSLEVIDAGKLWHGLPGTNQRPGLIADVRNPVEFHVLVNRLTNVGEGFLLGGSLGMAAGKLRTAHGHAVRVLEQGDVPNKVSLHGNQGVPGLAQPQAARVITQQRTSLPNPMDLLS